MKRATATVPTAARDATRCKRTGLQPQDGAVSFRDERILHGNRPWFVAHGANETQISAGIDEGWTVRFAPDAAHPAERQVTTDAGE